MEWRVIEEFPNYIISEKGDIFKIKGRRSNIMMKCKEDKDGYYYIGLRNENGRFFRRVHQLVAKAFIPNDNKDFDIVNHKDGNKKNNHFLNLEWCDVSYNTKYSFDKLGREGVHSTDKKCKLYKDNLFIKEFDNIKEASKYASDNFDVSYSSLIKYYKSKDIKIIID